MENPTSSPGHPGFFVCGGGFVFYKMINCKVMLNESKNTHSMIRYIFINGLN